MFFVTDTGIRWFIALSASIRDLSSFIKSRRGGGGGNFNHLRYFLLDPPKTLNFLNGPSTVPPSP